MTNILSTSKTLSRKPYIYKVTNFETDQYYIGSQCSGKVVGVNYFTSSTNKKFKEGFKTYGEEKYEITIIKEFDDPKECVRVENYIIRNYMLLKDGLCLNKFYCCNGKKVFSRVGIPSPKKGVPLSEKTKQKISQALKGIPLVEETKQKMSQAKKGLPTWNKGIPQSEETRKKISIALKGRPGTYKGSHHSEETRKKISEAHKIKISINGTVFDSLTETSKYYNVCTRTIISWAKNNKHNAVYIKK